MSEGYLEFVCEFDETKKSRAAIHVRFDDRGWNPNFGVPWKLTPREKAYLKEILERIYEEGIQGGKYAGTK